MTPQVDASWKPGDPLFTRGNGVLRRMVDVLPLDLWWESEADSARWPAPRDCDDLDGGLFAAITARRIPAHMLGAR